MIPMDKKSPSPPDLDEWIRTAGGYQNIDWAAWDQANAEYQAAYRERLANERQK
jgi:hypothetical protein